MRNHFWKTPAWNVPVEEVNQVELLKIPNKEIIPEEGWPETFWMHVSQRQLMTGKEAKQLLNLFHNLEPGMSARCHMPPWGLACYENERLLFTVTLCFECSNAYVYTADGQELRAFDTEEIHAIKLLNWLQDKMPLTEGA